jgi:hypothetical protein
MRILLGEIGAARGEYPVGRQAAAEVQDFRLAS